MTDAVPAQAGVVRPREAIEQTSQGASSDAIDVQPPRVSQPPGEAGSQVSGQAADSSPSRHPTKRGANDARARTPPHATELGAAPHPPASPQPSEVSDLQPSEAASLAGAFDLLETGGSATDATPSAPPLQPPSSAAEMPPHAANSALAAPGAPIEASRLARGRGVGMSIGVGGVGVNIGGVGVNIGGGVGAVDAIGGRAVARPERASSSRPPPPA